MEIRRICSFLSEPWDVYSAEATFGKDSFKQLNIKLKFRLAKLFIQSSGKQQAEGGTTI